MHSAPDSDAPSPLDPVVCRSLGEFGGRVYVGVCPSLFSRLKRKFIPEVLAARIVDATLSSIPGGTPVVFLLADGHERYTLALFDYNSVDAAAARAHEDGLKLQGAFDEAISASPRANRDWPSGAIRVLHWAQMLQLDPSYSAQTAYVRCLLNHDEKLQCALQRLACSFVVHRKGERTWRPERIEFAQRYVLEELVALLRGLRITLSEGEELPPHTKPQQKNSNQKKSSARKSDSRDAADASPSSSSSSSSSRSGPTSCGDDEPELDGMWTWCLGGEAGQELDQAQLPPHPPAGSGAPGNSWRVLLHPALVAPGQHASDHPISRQIFELVRGVRQLDASGVFGPPQFGDDQRCLLGDIEMSLASNGLADSPPSQRLLTHVELGNEERMEREAAQMEQLQACLPQLPDSVLRLISQFVPIEEQSLPSSPSSPVRLVAATDQPDVTASTVTGEGAASADDGGAALLAQLGGTPDRDAAIVDIVSVDDIDSDNHKQLWSSSLLALWHAVFLALCAMPGLLAAWLEELVATLLCRYPGMRCAGYRWGLSGDAGRLWLHERFAALSSESTGRPLIYQVVLSGRPLVLLASKKAVDDFYKQRDKDATPKHVHVRPTH